MGWVGWLGPKGPYRASKHINGCSKTGAGAAPNAVLRSLGLRCSLSRCAQEEEEERQREEEERRKAEEAERRWVNAFRLLF